jgi:hypothetical protein
MSKFAAYSVYVDGRFVGKVNGTDELNAADNARSKWRVHSSHVVSVMLIPR